MSFYTVQPDLFEPTIPVDEAACALRMLDLLRVLGDAPDDVTALDHLEEALHLMDADSAVFVSFVREATTRSAFRWLLACDPLWALEYSTQGWHEHDPWLRHALHGTEPTRDTELHIQPDEQAFASTSARLGFASAVIVPAPTDAGSSRVGMLCIGSRTPGFFTEDVFNRLRVPARALAMELHRWVLRSARRELIGETRITDDEIELLRHEAAGRTSKHIGALLDIEAKTVDSRFQKVLAKLQVPDRHTAARVARLYGVI